MSDTAHHSDMNPAQQNMLLGQVRTWGVHDPAVLASIEHIPRQEFISPDWRDHACTDSSLPLPHGEITMSPRIEARIMQATSPAGGERVLEIGTGCGYLTALMAMTVDRVVSYEWHADIAAAAEHNFALHNMDNITCITGDGLTAAAKGEQWDIIVLGGAVRHEQDFAKLNSCLAPGGRMFVIIGTELLQEGRVYTNEHQLFCRQRHLFSCRLPQLHGIDSATTTELNL